MTVEQLFARGNGVRLSCPGFRATMADLVDWWKTSQQAISF